MKAGGLMRKPIENYENFYEVDSEGYVFSKRFRKNLKPFKCRQGYLYVDLFDGESKKRFAIHRLVAKHFKEGYADHKVVNHMNKDKLNNDHTNLEWVTQRENILHANARKIAKLDKDTLEVIKTYDAIVDAELDGFKTPEIVHCCKGRQNSHYGFKWKYVD